MFKLPTIYVNIKHDLTIIMQLTKTMMWMCEMEKFIRIVCFVFQFCLLCLRRGGSHSLPRSTIVLLHILLCREMSCFLSFITLALTTVML